VHVVTVVVQAVTAEVAHVLPVDAWTYVVELAQNSVLGNVDDDLQQQRRQAGQCGEVPE
jgi:hypothetical protein